MADDADRAPEAAITTPGDKVKDAIQNGKPTDEPKESSDKAPGTFGDEPKKKRGRPPGSKNRSSAPTDTSGGKTKAWMVKRLTPLITSPAFVFEAVGEQWPKEHIDRTGPGLAQEIANYADRNPAFKLRLEAFLEGGETAGLIFAIAMYVAPLGIYFGVIPAPPRVAMMLGVPSRDELAGVAPQGFGPPSPEDLLAEAQAKGFDDVGEYMTAVQEAIGEVRK